MTGSTSSAHRLLVSDAALELMIGSIAMLSRRTRRFETLRQVVLHVLGNGTDLAPWKLERFFKLMPLDGSNCVHLKITRKYGDGLDTLREQLGARSGRNCSVKEAVCFCCFVVSDNQL